MQDAHSSSDDNVKKNFNTSVIFSIRDKVGSLTTVLESLKNLGVNLTKLESRPNHGKPQHFDFFVDLEGDSSDQHIVDAISSLKNEADELTVLGAHPSTVSQVAWFPHHISQLDLYASRVLGAGTELESNHPGFNDPVYRDRRKEIVEAAEKYKHGKPLPRIKYTDAEVSTWREAYTKLTAMYPSHAYRQHRELWPLLERNCGYGPDKVPDLNDVSRFLKRRTGFTVRPVAGLLSSRDFLNGLAFRVFHSTQYLRHGSNALYTPEPDIIHELLGHVPLFADPAFADFSQEIGLASLGATDEEIDLLGTNYWFTVEFGLCREDGALKAYGAGLLSSFGELEYSLSGKPKIYPFDPALTCKQKYPITEYQPVYFVSNSFEEATSKMRDYAKTLKRPFSVRYNALTECVEILNDRAHLTKLLENVTGQLSVLTEALSKLPVK